jgi:hypothetical protein
MGSMGVYGHDPIAGVSAIAPDGKTIPSREMTPARPKMPPVMNFLREIAIPSDFFMIRLLFQNTLVQWIFIMKLYRLQIISSLLKRDPHGTDLSSSILIVPALLKDTIWTKRL